MFLLLKCHMIQRLLVWLYTKRYTAKEEEGFFIWKTSLLRKNTEVCFQYSSIFMCHMKLISDHGVGTELMRECAKVIKRFTASKFH